MAVRMRICRRMHSKRGNPCVFAGIEFVAAVVTNIGNDFAEVTFLDNPTGNDAECVCDTHRLQCALNHTSNQSSLQALQTSSHLLFIQTPSLALELLS